MTDIHEKDSEASGGYGAKQGADGHILSYDEVHGEQQASLMTRLGLSPSSFKRRTLGDSTNQLNKTMKHRHLQMIAIGGSIGGGFFVGSGSALNKGGPGSLVIDFIIMGVMIL